VLVAKFNKNEPFVSIIVKNYKLKLHFLFLLGSFNSPRAFEHKVR